MKMKKVLAAFLAGIMLVGCGTKANVGENHYKQYESEVDAYVNAIDMQYAYDLAYKLSYDEALGGSNGFRTSGSTYEHMAADYLVTEMKNIGLTDIEKVPTTVDLWQFDESRLTIEGTDIDIDPASYAQSGTDDDGITAQIVNVGDGLMENYEDKDVEGKIVLVAIDQRNVAWIDGYIQEAKLHGAVALVSYSVGGYSMYSDDIRSIQDVCTDDIMPTVSVSRNEAKAIAKAIEAGHDTCTLMVKNQVVPEGGTSYMVTGLIKGKSSDQQIIYAGHYDKYFYGFQDDSCAISTIMTIAKAMKDSGYEPENDIRIVCHGAEEWGASGSQFDWTTGAWEAVNHETNWEDNTIAMFNFELPAWKEPDVKKAFVAAVPEFSTYVGNIVDNYGDKIDTGAFEEGIDRTSVPTATMEDGISYRFAGVPYILNGLDFTAEEYFAGQRYHSEADDTSTYDEEAFKSNIIWFGIMGIISDQNPAIELDLTRTADWLLETINEEHFALANVDVENYKATVENFKTAVSKLYEDAVATNKEYAQAAAKKDTAKMADLRKQGATLNEKVLEVFQIIQDYMIGVESSATVVTFHEGYSNTIDLLQGGLKACEEGVDWAEDGETGSLDQLWQVNCAIAYNSVIFSKENAEKTNVSYTPDAELFWGTDKVIEFAAVDDAIRFINEEADFESAKPLIQKALDRAVLNFNTYVTKETEGLNKAINYLK